MLDGNGRYADPKPSHVYKFQNSTINPDGDGKIKQIRQAYSTKSKISDQYEEYLGLTSKNQSLNFFKSAEDVRDRDFIFSGEHGNYILKNGSVNDVHLGVLREYRVSYGAIYNCGTTPLQVIL